MYKKPKDLIPRDTMVLFLTDMYLAVASKNTKHKTTNKRNNYMPLVYNKYKIDSSRFYSSNNFYTSKIEDYGDILNEVKSNIKEKNEIFLTALNLKDSLKNAKKNEKKRLRDSIKNAKIALKRLPKLLEKPVIDSLFFYEKTEVYLREKPKEYEHILIVKDEDEDVDFEFEEDEEDEKVIEKSSINLPEETKSKKKRKKSKKERDAFESKKLKKIKEKLKRKRVKPNHE